MQLTIYLIIEEGADRIYVQPSYPHSYVRPVGRASRIIEVRIPLPAAGIVDGRVTLSPDAVHVE